jgi:hypothetical protein
MRPCEEQWKLLDELYNKFYYNMHINNWRTHDFSGYKRAVRYGLDDKGMKYLQDIEALISAICILEGRNNNDSAFNRLRDKWDRYWRNPAVRAWQKQGDSSLKGLPVTTFIKKLTSATKKATKNIIFKNKN